MRSSSRSGKRGVPSQFAAARDFSRRTMTAASCVAVGRDAAGEALVVEQFQQRGEALRVAVVRRGREEQLVLEVRRERADGLRCAASRWRTGRARTGRRCAPRRRSAGRSGAGRSARRSAGSASRNRRSGRSRLRKSIEVIRRGKWVHGLTCSPRSRRRSFISVAVDDAELQAELVAHLVAPLDLQRGGADDQHRARAVAQDQLLDDQARLDRLAQADVVGDQQVDARHLDGAHDRVELVVLDRDAAAERALAARDVGAWTRRPSARRRGRRRAAPAIIEADRRGQRGSARPRARPARSPRRPAAPRPARRPRRR